jgi:hypothetical protein
VRRLGGLSRTERRLSNYGKKLMHDPIFLSGKSEVHVNARDTRR